MSFSQFIFECILNSESGDYVAQALILKAMKPTGYFSIQTKREKF